MIAELTGVWPASPTVIAAVSSTKAIMTMRATFNETSTTAGAAMAEPIMLAGLCPALLCEVVFLETTSINYKNKTFPKLGHIRTLFTIWAKVTLPLHTKPPFG
ncbi:MAG TPA: hypothetical protein VE133_01365 [Candidatus Sulfotelmatobacter sp.]|jgi:hypothetical protein|nr:hypothetical protein [Candidatus Sulfotelmatobacter sp.]